MHKRPERARRERKKKQSATAPAAKLLSSALLFVSWDEAAAARMDTVPDCHCDRVCA